MLILLLACTTASSPSDTANPAADTADSADIGACDGTGTIHACVVRWDGSAGAGLKVKAVISTDPGHPLQTLAGADGCADLALDPGEWTLWADDFSGSGCMSEQSAVTLAACTTEPVSLNVDDLCAG